MVKQGAFLHYFHGFQLLQAGLLQNLVFSFVGVMLKVAYVGDVAYVADLVAKVAQEACKDVVGYAGTGVAKVGVTVNGGAANVHSYHAGIDGLE